MEANVLDFNIHGTIEHMGKEALPLVHVGLDGTAHAAATGTLIGIGLGSIIALNTPILVGAAITIFGIHEAAKGIKHIREKFAASSQA